MTTKPTLVDHGPVGPRGFDFYYWARRQADGTPVLCAYVLGTDHVLDWIHHVTPGARAREMEAAFAMAELLTDLAGEAGTNLVDLGGISLGGCLVEATGSLLQARGLVVRATTWGGKRVPRGYAMARPGSIVRYVARGDLVALLPPWRPRGALTYLEGPWRPVWRAHAWDTYNQGPQGMREWQRARGWA